MIRRGKGKSKVIVKATVPKAGVLLTLHYPTPKTPLAHRAPLLSCQCDTDRVTQASLDLVLLHVFFGFPYTGTGREPRSEAKGRDGAQDQYVEHPVAAHDIILQREREKRGSGRGADSPLHGHDSLCEAIRSA